jgi:hypothetical protein
VTIEFKRNYEAFARKNSRFFLIDEDVKSTFEAAQIQGDIRGAANIFGINISSALRTIELKKKGSEGKWTTKLGNILTKLYPVTRLSLGLAKVVGEVPTSLP